MKKIILIISLILSFTTLSFAQEKIKKTYYDTGELFCEITLKNNIYNGPFTCYYKNGALEKKGTFINGKTEGKREIYYETGEILQTDTYKNDKLDGITQIYYKNGALNQKVVFKNGKREGPMKYYNQDGSLWAIINYKNDEIINAECSSGRKWNDAEIHNWSKGLSVSCNQK